jgi:hypothetical protein
VNRSCEPPDVHEIDATLALLGSVQPRDGLVHRVTRRLHAEQLPPWYRRAYFMPTGRNRWMMATASATIVAATVTISTLNRHAALSPVPVSAPHPMQQPLRPAASVAVNQHPLQANPSRTLHRRGIHHSSRATHGRVPLPHGTMAPLPSAAAAH